MDTTHAAGSVVERPRALIVDTDAGVDDAQALVLLLSMAARLHIRVAAITCVAGAG